MKIGLSMWSVHQRWFDGSWGVRDFIHFCEAIPSLQGVELLSMFWRDRETEIPMVLKLLEETQLAIASYSASNNFATGDPQEWSRQVKEVEDAVRTADRLGARVVRVFSGDLKGDASFDRARAQIVDGLRRAAACAKEYGVLLCLENHGLLAGKAEQVKGIIQDVGSDALRSTFDTGNFLLVDENPVHSLSILSGLIGHVHFKDFKKADAHSEGRTYRSLSGDPYIGAVSGKGDIDFGRILAGLRQMRYSGWLSVEFEGEGDPLEGSRESVQALAKWLATDG